MEGENQLIELCACPVARTRQYVADNHNLCPNADCGKPLMEENLYEQPRIVLNAEAEVERDPEGGDDHSSQRRDSVKSEEGEHADSEGAQNLHRILAQLAISSPNFGSTKDRPGNSGVKLKPPSYAGKSGVDPKHFFVKLENYLDSYRIKTQVEKIRILKQCLEGSALDLFLTLEPEVQADLKILEQKFKTQFAPKGHDLVETQDFMKSVKNSKQSISEFHTQIMKTNKSQ